MSVETDLRALLSGYGGLTALVGTRIATHSVPQGSAMPLVVLTASETYEYGLASVLHARQVVYSIQCWALLASDADAVAAQVIAALATNADYEITSVASAFDQELDLNAVEVTADRWIV